MQRRIGRSAGRRHDRARILQRAPRDKVARQRPAALQDVHHDVPGTLCNRQPLRVDARHHRGIRHRQSERFGHHRHRVGGELPGAGADARLAGALQNVQVRFAHRAGLHRADAFIGIEHRHLVSLKTPRQRGSAIEKYPRHVAAHEPHHRAGQGLVAAAERDEPVIGVALHHRFDRVRDQLAAHQRELHALVVHGDAVGDHDGGELARRAAGRCHTFLRGVDLRPVRHVARRHLALLAHHPDHRLGDRRVVEAHRAHEGAVRRAIKAVGGDARAQPHVSFRPAATRHCHRARGGSCASARRR